MGDLNTELAAIRVLHQPEPINYANPSHPILSTPSTIVPPIRLSPKFYDIRSEPVIYASQLV